MVSLISKEVWASWLLLGQGAAILAMVVGILSLRFEWLPFMPAFYTYGLSLLVIVGLGLIGILAYAGSFMAGAPAWRGPSLTAFIVGLGFLALVIGIVGPGNFSKPLIHDITTDWLDPPQFEAARAERGPNENTLDYPGETLGRIQAQAYPGLNTLYISMPSAAAFRRAEAVAQSLGWTILASDEEAGRIEAYATTPWLGFTDDVVIRIRTRAGVSEIDLRSVSRVGQGDFGANASRIGRFIEAFGTEEEGH